MHIAYDPAGVVGVAGRLSVAAQDAGRVAAATGTVATGVGDAALAVAVATLADVCGDVLDVVALDLDLLAGRVRSGAALYDVVESRAASGQEPLG